MKKTIFLYFILGFMFFLSFILLLGEYPLLDIDETRYVAMAKYMYKTKDFLTLYLNGDYFFEKPPLFFWLECISFKINNSICELSARLPVVILSLLPCSLLFCLCRKVKDDLFAFVTISVLFTCLEYIFMTKLAILDSIMTSFTVSSVFSYFYTYFAEEKNKKYFWILTYIFMGLGVLAKGIPAFVIPIAVIIISGFVFKSHKETIKYSVFFLLFLAVTLPWHIIMIKLHGNLFIDEYIIKHHILRFLGSEVINRARPWYFYFVTLLWGLFPHIFILLPKLFTKKTLNFTDNYSKFILMNVIAAVSILAFFSFSGTKLITYILPIYPFMAVIIGSIWLNYIDKGDKTVQTSLIVLNIIFILSSIGFIFVKFLIPEEIYINFSRIQTGALLIIIPTIICNIAAMFYQKRLQVFIYICLSNPVSPAFFAVCLEFSLRSKRIASEALPLPALACRLPGCARPKIRSSTPKNWGSLFEAPLTKSYSHPSGLS